VSWSIPLKQILEAALLAAGGPLAMDRLLELFSDEERPEPKRIRAVLDELAGDYQGRGIELKEVASGWRIQVRKGGEIEDIRGVGVSTQIVKTLLEREWVRVVGHRDVPGKPALYATTRRFLDYFGLKSLDELPTLQQLKDLDEIAGELPLEEPQQDLPLQQPAAEPTDIPETT
jgi:segregation and condensation protein B